MVERFTDRIDDELGCHRLNSVDDLQTKMHRNLLLYNQQFAQSDLRSKTAEQAKKNRQKLMLDLCKNAISSSDM
jgi:hypothetical protein